jgi:DnaK suppressor protein
MHHLLEEQITQIRNLLLEIGTYGICKGCGAEIPFERLMARPVTTLCINCKELEEEGEHE